MMLAEAVSIDGGLLLVILFVFLLMVGLWCVVVALGCRWAKQAGQGSRGALAGWAVVAVLEVVPLALGFTPLLVLAAVVLAFQGWLYARARAETMTEGEP